MEPCPHCAALVKLGARFCGKCGQVILRSSIIGNAAEVRQAAPFVVPLDVVAPPSVVAAAISAVPVSAVADVPAPAMPVAADVPEVPSSAEASALPELSVAPAMSFDHVEPVVASAPMAAPEVSATPTTPPRRNPAFGAAPAKPVPFAAIGAAVVLTTLAAGAALYVLRPAPNPASPAQATVTAAPQTAPPATAPAPAVTITSDAPRANVTPAPEPASEPVAVSPAPAAVTEVPPVVTAPPESGPALPRHVKPEPKPVSKSVSKPVSKSIPTPVPSLAATPPSTPAPGRDEGVMTGAINASLDEGMQCMNQKKFDCAIANANTVLRLAPGNRQAQDMRRRAKEAQDRAMSQIKIE